MHCPKSSARPRRLKASITCKAEVVTTSSSSAFSLTTSRLVSTSNSFGLSLELVSAFLGSEILHLVYLMHV